jgi:hypothetical protein
MVIGFFDLPNEIFAMFVIQNRNPPVSSECHTQSFISLVVVSDRSFIDSQDPPNEKTENCGGIIFTQNLAYMPGLFTKFLGIHELGTRLKPCDDLCCDSGRGRRPVGHLGFHQLLDASHNDEISPVSKT